MDIGGEVKCYNEGMRRIASIVLAAMIVCIPRVYAEDQVSYPVIQQNNSAAAAVSQSSPDLEALITGVFGASSPMISVVRCESHFRQYDSSGAVLASPTGDYGIMQINLKTWGDTAKGFGLDINTIGGNIAMGMYIYRTAGIKQWVCARLLGFVS